MKHYTKNYDSLNIILVLKKRFILFVVTLIICLIFGSFWVKSQIDNINKIQESINTTEKIAQQEQLFYILLKIKKYHSISIPKNVLNDIFLQYQYNGIIDDYRLYAESSFFDIYAIFTPNPLNKQESSSLLTALENDPIITQIKNDAKVLQQSLKQNQKAFISDIITNGFFKILPTDKYISFIGQKPINKHYIYLDKNRKAYDGSYEMPQLKL